MPVFSLRIAVLLVALGSLVLSSCAGSASARAGTPEFYWSAAKQTYIAGDYMKTLEDLDQLIDGHNDYSARALPWSLVLTSGMAAGYMELADQFSAGARVNKANALAFRRKATEYRTMASPLVLRFAQNVDKLNQLPAGSISLAFPLPRGNASASGLLSHVSAGTPLSPTDLEIAQTIAIQHSVLMTACVAAGAPNDTAKAAEVLGHASTITPRAAFASSLAKMLETQASIYGRDKLDYPEKLAIVRQRAENLRNSGAAMLVNVHEASR